MLSASIAAKAGAVAAVLALGIAMTLSSAEASDQWADTVVVVGNIEGDSANVLGAVDALFVQIGTDAGGGSITIGFADNVAFNGPHYDIRIHTVDADFPATATIEVSADGVTFVSAGEFSDALGDIDLDLEDYHLSFASAVRITHVGGALPGFDLNAVTALNQIDLDNLVFSLAPPTDTSAGFTEHIVTATLGAIAPTEGVPVNFEVTDGPNIGANGIRLTDAAGQAAFGWIGENGPGSDIIGAWLDLNGNGELDGDEPSAIAVHQWFGVTGTLEIIDVDGNGLVVGDLVQVIVNDHDLDVTDGLDTVDVTVTSDPSGGSITVTLTETGDHTGVFTGLLTLGEATDDGADVLAAADSDQITATYIDELDGENNEGVEVPASLTVQATEEAGAKATICHRPPGNPGNQHTLNVGSSAVPAHLGHGDTIGECGESDVLSKQEEQQELKEQRDAEREQAKTDREADREQDRLERDEQRLDRETDRNAAFCDKKPDHKRCAEEE